MADQPLAGDHEATEMGGSKAATRGTTGSVAGVTVDAETASASCIVGP